MKRVLKRCWRRATRTVTVATTLASYVLVRTAEGGGTIGWADAVGQFSDEGAAVGAFAVILGIMAVGAIVMFGITGLITTVVMVCLGGALMGQAEAVGQTLFGAGTGGGSIHDVTVPQGRARLSGGAPHGPPRGLDHRGEPGPGAPAQPLEPAAELRGPPDHDLPVPWPDAPSTQQPRSICSRSGGRWASW